MESYRTKITQRQHQKLEESIVQLLTVKTAVTIHMAIVQDIISFDFRRKLSKEIDGVIGSKGNMERTASQLIVRLLCVQSI